MTKEFINTGLAISAYKFMLKKLLIEQKTELSPTEKQTNKTQYEACKKTLQELIVQHLQESTVNEIVKGVCNFFQIEFIDLISAKKHPKIHLKVCLFLLSKHGFSYREIAKELGICKGNVSHHIKWLSNNMTPQIKIMIFDIEFFLTNPNSNEKTN